MKPKRPTPVLVIGILHLTFGGLGLLGSLCSVVFSAFMKPIFAAMPTAPGAPPMPAPPDDLVFSSVLSYSGWLVLAGVTLVCGIGLVGMRPWARKLCIGLVPIAVLIQAFVLYMDLGYAAEANEQWGRAMIEWQEQTTKAAPGAVATPAMDMGAVARFSLVVYGLVSVLIVGYALACAVFMFMPDVVAAFAASKRTGPVDEEPSKMTGANEPGPA